MKWIQIFIPSSTSKKHPSVTKALCDIFLILVLILKDWDLLVWIKKVEVLQFNIVIITIELLKRDLKIALKRLCNIFYNWSIFISMSLYLPIEISNLKYKFNDIKLKKPFKKWIKDLLKLMILFLLICYITEKALKILINLRCNCTITKATKILNK